MEASTTDDLGPVDYLVVEFPSAGAHFSGEMVKELASLVEAELIQVLDVVVVRKNEDGSVDAHEIDDLEPVDGMRRIESQVAEILAVDDVARLAEAIAPGSTASVLVWENTWAVPFATAARRAGGQLVAGGRIPTQAIVDSLQAEEADAGGGRPCL